jgi:hypothetical protein
MFYRNSQFRSSDFHGVGLTTASMVMPVQYDAVIDGA